MERLTDQETGRMQRRVVVTDRWLAHFSGLRRLFADERQVTTRCALATLAVVLQLCLVVFGIVRTDTVVHVNHLFPFADKAWHLLWYGGVVVLLWIALGGRALAVLVIAAAFAVLDEGVQAFTPGRSADLADLAVDIAAVCLAVGALSCRRALASRRSTREST